MEAAKKTIKYVNKFEMYMASITSLTICTILFLSACCAFCVKRTYTEKVKATVTKVHCTETKNGSSNMGVHCVVDIEYEVHGTIYNKPIHTGIKYYEGQKINAYYNPNDVHDVTITKPSNQLLSAGGISCFGCVFLLSAIYNFHAAYTYNMNTFGTNDILRRI